MRLLTMSLCLPLVACNPDDPVKHLPDARVQDGPGLVDAAPAPVTLTITKDGAPQVGERVYFQNADSSVVLATVTDATGTASAVMVAGGYVTAVNPFALPAVGAGPDQLDTWLGVKPGDHLVLRQQSQTGISFTITVPLSSNQLVTQYEVSTPCGGVSLASAGSGALPSGTISLSGCGATTDFMVVAENGTSPVEFFYMPGQAVADQQALDLSAQTYAAAAARSYTYNNTPGTITNVAFSDTVVSPHGQVFTTSGGSQSGTTTLTGTLQVPTFTGAADVVQSDVFPGQAGNQHFVDWAPYATTYTTDMTARLLSDFTAYPAFDPATHTLAWTEAAGGVAPDFSLTTVNGFRQIDARSWGWTIVAPHGGASIAFPTLPTDVYDFNFAANEASSTNLIVAKVPGGYDAVRAQILAASNGPTQLITGATGEITYQDLAPLGARVAPAKRRPALPPLRTRR